MNTVYDSKFYDTTREVEFDAVKKADVQGQRIALIEIQVGIHGCKYCNQHERKSSD